MSYNLICRGKALSDGGSPITENGFYYTGTTVGSSSILASLVPSPNEFSATIISINPGETFDIKSYAKNVMGTKISTETMTGKTLGTVVQATMKSEIQPTSQLYEIGGMYNITSNLNFVKNDETILKSLSIVKDTTSLLSVVQSTLLDSYSSPFIFSPTPSTMNTTIFFNASCGLYPTYALPQQTILIESVYPYLWTMDKNSKNTTNYYNRDTDFYEISNLNNYKFIGKKDDGLTILDFKIPDGGNYIHIGHPSSYGQCSKIFIDSIEISTYTIGDSSLNPTPIVSSLTLYNWATNYYIYNIDVTKITAGSFITISLIF